MAATKTCPSCDQEVPVSADRCKNCFHDFNEAPKRSTGGPLFLLAAFAAMAVVGTITLFVIVSRPVEQKILVDQETESVVWTTKYRTGLETERLPWDDVVKLEYKIGSTGGFEILAVTTDAERKVIEESDSPLAKKAEKYSKLMGKELEVIDDTRGFHKLD